MAELEGILKQIFTDGYTSKVVGNWKAYLGFRGEEAISIQVWGNHSMDFGIKVFPNLPSAPVDTINEIHNLIVNSGLVVSYSNYISLNERIHYTLKQQ